MKNGKMICGGLIDCPLMNDFLVNVGKNCIPFSKTPDAVLLRV
ncbi:unnamed protein product [Camellia sinensis]